MNTNVYRFVFEPQIVLEEAEMTLQLAIFAAEGLFGAARVRLDFGYFVDEPSRTIIVAGTTEVGETIIKIFTGLALREFGEDAFRTRRIEANQNTKAS